VCGRYAFALARARATEHLGLAACADYAPRWNIPPGTDIPVIRLSPEGDRVLHLLRWGLVPHWARDPSLGARLNNARAESAAVKPAFRDAFRRRRCLIPADGFYEWQASGGIKQPYYISAADGQPLALGGLWESWRTPEGEVLRTCAILTTGPNGLMKPIHDRMPVILPPQAWGDWLAAPANAIQALLAPCPEDWLRAWPVDRRVSRASEDGPHLTRPLPDA